ncbi:MAG: tRNA (uracil-5-)-methyltransferase [Cellvibrionaceae bacterium]|jgi:tRNA (uracil-5-)-methyltransferase
MTIPIVDPSNYTEQLDGKIAAFQETSKSLAQTLPSAEIYSSPPRHYRLRAEFRIWHEARRACYAMTDSSTGKPIFLEQYPVASEKINQLMPTLLSAINQSETLRKKLFQVEFLSTLAQDAIITLIYHRPLEEDWVQAAEVLQRQLGVVIVGRSRKQKVVLSRNWVEEKLQVGERIYRYRQIEGSFSQPNGHICEQMLSWAIAHTQTCGGDLLEMYCGNGNFTLPLAQNFRKILATEISKSLVAMALHNLRDNAIDNVAIVRMSSEDMTQAMNGVRAFHRLQNVDLKSYDFSSVFVDPPRAGLDDDTLAMVQRFDQIIYFSCNPSSLVANLQKLVNQYRVEALALFDQFPYTPHLEVGVILKKF